MIPIIIIPENEVITMTTNDFKKYINDSYKCGYDDGVVKGKYEALSPITYPIWNYGTTTKMNCNEVTT